MILVVLEKGIKIKSKSGRETKRRRKRHKGEKGNKRRGSKQTLQSSITGVWIDIVLKMVSTGLAILQFYKDLIGIKIQSNENNFKKS